MSGPRPPCRVCGAMDCLSVDCMHEWQRRQAGAHHIEADAIHVDPFAELATLRAEVARLQAERDAAVTEALCARDLRKLLDEADVEVERLRGELSRMVPINWWTEQCAEAEEAISIAALAMSAGLTECERLRADVVCVRGMTGRTLRAALAEYDAKGGE